MFMTLATVALAASALVARTDTSFSVRPGTRLVVTNFGGAITVRPWNRSAVRVEATHPQAVRILLSREGTVYDVRAVTRREIVVLPAPSRGEPAPQARRHVVEMPFPTQVDYHISAPAWMALNLEGVYSDLAVEGWRGDVLARTVRGRVRVRGGDGLVQLAAIDGFVDVGGARGRLRVNAMNDGVTVSDYVGEVFVEAVKGDVTLERVRSRMIEAATVTGNVRFAGGIDRAGRYRFTSHAGNLDVELPEHPSAIVNVSTFRGAFESAFPLPLGRVRRGRDFSFTLGDGAAVIDLQTFEGLIRVECGARRE